MKLNPAEQLLHIHLRESGIDFTPQVRLDAKRRYTWDFVVGSLAIEIQGGIWRNKGAHNTGKAITRDCEKSRCAIMNNHIPCYFTSQDVLNGTAIDWIRGYQKKFL